MQAGRRLSVMSPRCGASIGCRRPGQCHQSPGSSKLRALIRKSADQGYPLPIDTLYAQLGRSRALETKVAFPYLIGINEGLSSTMADRNNVQIHMHNMITNMFVVGADPSNTLKEAKAYLAESDPDVEALIASRVLYERLKQE